MISKPINLTTGPVGITTQVQKALQEAPLSHRSTAFRHLYDQTTGFLSDSFHVRDTYLLTGSGTLANEVMLQEIKCIGGKGLILSNGEFGNRLIRQANRNSLDFLTYTLEWGEIFDLNNIEYLLIENQIKWLLCCHCETSTGMITDLNKLTELAARYKCLCFMDCMSTAGTTPLNLSGLAMATASSGKGLASIPGLAVVFSNIGPTEKSDCPVYLDLYQYKNSAGIPFTIPSNLVKALYISVHQKLNEEQYQLINHYRKAFFNLLSHAALVPFSNNQTSVFTIVPPETTAKQVMQNLMHQGIQLSYESDYLKIRNWYQLATFGYYTEKQLKLVAGSLNLMRKCLNPMTIQNQQRSYLGPAD